MKLKITAMFYAAWMLISSVAVGQTNAAAPEGNSLAALEATALDYLKDNPNRAIEIYNYYESTIKAEGWDELQPDLLYNQAIASYRAGKTGAAIGYLKQLDLVQPSAETSDQIHELQMLVEHNVYRQAPGTMFVRGESNEFALWRMMQQFSESAYESDSSPVLRVRMNDGQSFLSTSPGLTPSLPQTYSRFTAMIITDTIIEKGITVRNDVSSWALCLNTS